MNTPAEAPIDSSIWPRADYSRIPYRLYHDAAIYERERELIFRGPVWNYLGLEAEIPKPGDFITTWLGDIPVVLNRARSGELYAFVNRCAHRGAIVRRETHGNALRHVCIYHRWCYGQKGELVGVPLRRGIKGQGGLSDEFAVSDHGLETVRIATYRGIVFGTFCSDTEPLDAYLGPAIRGHLDTMTSRPVQLLGYHRQIIHGNWKLYNENLRDSYHASLLHEFLVTFGLDRATQRGGVAMDDRHRHDHVYAFANSDSAEQVKQAYGEHDISSDKLSLQRPEFLQLRPEFDDGKGLAISSVFPNAAFQRLQNSMATRQIRPKGTDAFELSWTFFGFADDSPEMTKHRLLQANLVGPAGLVSMEDAEAIEIVHRATRSERHAASVVEMGGAGAIADCEFRVNDVPVRGFWSYYSQLMGIEPAGAVR